MTSLLRTREPQTNSLRIICVGTLFVTNTLTVDQLPDPQHAPVVRASVVSESRGGSAASVASLLAQFNEFLKGATVEPALVASLADNEQGRLILDSLNREGVITRFSKIWPGYTVPSAWVVQTPQQTKPVAQGGSHRTIINHNSLPDLSHDDFIALLGPVLAPENFGYFPSSSPADPSSTGGVSNPSAGVTFNNHPTPMSPSTPSSHPQHHSYSTTPHFPLYSNTNNPAPFDWLHFEGRSAKTTLNNMLGVHSLASEKHWRSHCVFSLDLGRKHRQGIEALIPHADVIFVNKRYADAVSPNYSNSPRSFLLSLTSVAPKHSLLVADWGCKEGAAVLSVPTRDYFQSSPWVKTDTPKQLLPPERRRPGEEHVSVRSGSSVYWAYGRDTPSATTDEYDGYSEDDLSSSQYTEHHPASSEIVDEVGAADSFIAGMIYALSRSLLPGTLYTPFSTPDDIERLPKIDKLGGKWRLEECLRFATELSGRKARKMDWSGLAKDMAESGWAF